MIIKKRLKRFGLSLFYVFLGLFSVYFEGVVGLGAGLGLIGRAWCRG